MSKKKKRKAIQNIPLKTPVFFENLKISPEEALSAKIYFGLCFVLYLALYLMTLCPTVYAGDAGQFLAITHTMGIAHPPGHPTYLLIGKLFDMIPFGNPSFGLNFMSAFFGALAVGVTFLVLRRIIYDFPQKDLIAFISVLFFGTSGSFWEYSLFAETYTLNMFFVAMLALIVLRIKDDRTEGVYRQVALFGLLAGIGAGNHPAIVLWMPTFILLVFILRRDVVFSFRAARNLIISGLAGFSVYFYVYFRGMMKPQFDIPRITSFQKFIYTLMARQYGNVPMAKTPLTLKSVAGGVLDTISWGGGDFTFWVWVITLVSLIVAFRKYFKVLLPFFLPVIFLMAAGIVNPAAKFSLDRTSYGIGAFFVFTLCIGAGLASLLGKIGSFKRAFPRQIMSAVVLFAVITAAAGQLQTNYAHADKSAKFLAYDAGMAVLDTMEQDAVLFIQKDWISFSLAYMTAVEKKRPDVTIYNRTSTMFPNLPGLFDRKFRSIYEVMQRANVMEDEFIKSTKRPVYFDDRKSLAKLPGYRIRNKGFLYKITEEKNDQVVSPFDDYYIRNLNDPPETKNMAECKIFIDYYVHLAEDRFEAGNKEEAMKALKKAEFYARETFSEKQNIMLVYVENGYYKEALELLEQQARLLPGYAVTYKKMGLLYAQYLKDSKKAVQYLTLYLDKDPFAYDRQAILELIKRISAPSAK